MKKKRISLKVNGETLFDSGINGEQSESKIELIVNQTIERKIHITKSKTMILQAMLLCFKEGGVNGIKKGSLNELAEIIANTFSFDYKGVNGVKATQKESILRSLRLCEQKLNE